MLARHRAIQMNRSIGQMNLANAAASVEAPEGHGEIQAARKLKNGFTLLNLVL